jgi:hypothetical protein
MAKAAKTTRTIGFGVPDEMDPHHFAVDIPAARDKDILIVEHFGVRNTSAEDSIERCRLPRTAWSAIASESARVLNERLKERGLATSRWTTGVNKVERLLGRELCMLAWAIEKADNDLIPGAIRAWAAFKPEERWWLFSMAASLTGTAEDADIGWRKALRIALTETPSGDEVLEIRKKRPRSDGDRPALPLFDKL